MWANAQYKEPRNVRGHVMLKDKTVSPIILTFFKVLHFPSLLHVNIVNCHMSNINQ